MQRSVVVNSFGGPQHWNDNSEFVATKAIPRPGVNEVLVRLLVRPVNPADGLSLMGLYPGFSPKAFPATPGIEGMGKVSALGEGVTEFQVGQRVVPLLLENLVIGEGSWQEYVVVSVDNLIPVPDKVSDNSAAQLVVNPLTADLMLELIAAPPGSYVLQTAAGSTLGRQFIVFAKLRGLKTINIVRRAAQAEELKALGADEVIVSTTEDVVERVKKITGGQMVWGAVDCVVGSLLKEVIGSVRYGGTVYIYGGLSGIEFSSSILDFIFRDVTLKGFWVTTCLKALAPETRKHLCTKVMDLLEQDILRPFSGETVDLANFKEAVKAQQVEGRQGKILLVG